MKKSLYILISSLAISSLSIAQNLDIVYLSDDSKFAGTVQDVGTSQVKFLPDNPNEKNPKVRKLERSNLTLIMYGNGAYLAFPNSYKGNTPPPENVHSDDWLLTLGGEVIACRVTDAESNPVKFDYSANDTTTPYLIPGDKILAILFADGKHRFFSKASLVSTQLRNKKMATKSSLSSLGANLANKPQNDLGNEIDLDNASFEQFKTKALQKSADLGRYLNQIANKSTDFQDANKAINNAVELFLSEDATVEISSSSATQKARLKIREYLNKLKLLKYSKVNIEWTDIYYVSNLRKGPDGNYYGVISLQQKFEGYQEGKVVYSDITRKNIEIVLKTYRKEVEGESLLLWDVFLSDIGINQEKS